MAAKLHVLAAVIFVSAHAVNDSEYLVPLRGGSLLASATGGGSADHQVPFREYALKVGTEPDPAVGTKQRGEVEIHFVTQESAPSRVMKGDHLAKSNVSVQADNKAKPAVATKEHDQVEINFGTGGRASPRAMTGSEHIASFSVTPAIGLGRGNLTVATKQHGQIKVDAAAAERASARLARSSGDFVPLKGVAQGEDGRHRTVTANESQQVRNYFAMSKMAHTVSGSEASQHYAPIRGGTRNADTRNHAEITKHLEQPKVAAATSERPSAHTGHSVTSGTTSVRKIITGDDSVHASNGVLAEEKHKPVVVPQQTRSWLIDAATAEGAGQVLEEAFKQELPGLEEVKHEVENTAASDSEGDESMPFAAATGGSVSEFESEVMALVLGLGKSSFGATPMGGSVKKIKNLIEKDMMPKVLAAHNSNQKQLNKLYAHLGSCAVTRNTGIKSAIRSHIAYKRASPLHKTCRSTEAGLFTDNMACWKDLREKKSIKDLKCRAYTLEAKRVGDQNKNKNIMNKGGSEAVVTYVKRITATVCGKPGGRGIGGYGADGLQDSILKAKYACESATRAWFNKDRFCKALDKKWHDTRLRCNNIQDAMDNAACKYAVDTKDACESYDECHRAKKSAYLNFEGQVRTEEADRKAEWKGLKRMHCIITAFADGKLKNSEIIRCKETTHSTGHLNMKYHKLPRLQLCKVPNRYPYTAAYKTAEFTPLPALAKGRVDANECTGVNEISTQPAAGSPKSCKCSRVTMNGPFAPGAIVKCVNCLDVRRTSDKISCPSNTKLFSPQGRQDWDSFLKSARPLRAPHWIVDVSRPQNGCGGCTRQPMNDASPKQKTWKTKDGSPWWLRSTRYNEPNGDYHANCYLDLWHNPRNANSVTFNDGSCSYHSKSYYCQAKKLSLTPKPGSPSGCVCKKVEIASGKRYSPGVLLKCTNCLKVSRAYDKNSCPAGTKIFAPSSREDWKAFIGSATPLRAPHWIIDVTRPQNGCGGCTRHPMNSKSPAQATWRTADGAKWWLRQHRYNEPNGDYTANCYLDLWQTPANENSVTFNDGRCNYRSKSYYCQRARTKKPKAPKPRIPPPWRICCKAKTATCLSCKHRVPVEEYCSKHPTIKGCYLAGLSTKPKAGSPSTCKCKMVKLKGVYSAGALLKCTNCLKVRKKTDKNSCPAKTKIFSPQNQQDWKTLFASIPNAKSAVAAPNWIVDVTRPHNSCGGCTRHAMNSGNAAQSSWKTSDGSPWWLRDATYSEPNGDYQANCYLDLWHSPTPAKMLFNDRKCTYHSKSYYCQPIAFK